MSPPLRSKSFVTSLLILATSVSILSTELYVPSLPSLQDYFATSAHRVQLTMSLNLLGYTLGQLVYGPLSDRFGRRPVLLLGMAGFALFSLFCALAWSIDMLIIARVAQGLLACSEAVVVLAMLRDMYDTDESVRVFAIYGMVIAIVPAIGPILGGYIHVLVGWQGNFYLLTLLCLMLLLAFWLYLPETGHPGADVMRPRYILDRYGALLRDRQFLAYALLSAFTLGGLFAYITEAPFVFIERHGVAISRYGYYQALVVLWFFLGSMWTRLAVRRIAVLRLLLQGMFIVLAGGLAQPLAVWTGFESPLVLAGLMSVYAFGMGIVFAIAPVKALDTKSAGRGMAAAMLGTLEMSGAALGAAMVGLLHDETAWALVLTVALFSLLNYAAWMLKRQATA